jgi:hypothetical protein
MVNLTMQSLAKSTLYIVVNTNYILITTQYGFPCLSSNWLLPEKLRPPPTLHKLKTDSAQIYHLSTLSSKFSTFSHVAISYNHYFISALTLTNFTIDPVF